MTTAERIRLLRRHGLENAVIAAVLGVNCDAIADHIADPSIDVAIPGGGGAVDVTGLLPLDGSRAATLIDFAGAPGDEGSGLTMAWDQDWYGLRITGREGSGDAEIYLSNPDDIHEYTNLYPGGLDLDRPGRGNSRLAGGAFVVGNFLGASLQWADYQLLQVPTAAERAFGIQTNSVGTPVNTLEINGDGSMHWGDGATTPDRHLHRVDPADPNIGWMPALQMDNGLVIADPDWDGLLVIDPDDYTGNQTWVGPDYVAVMEAVGATHQRATFSSAALTFVGEDSQIVLYGDVSALPFGGTASLSAYDSRLYLKKPQGHGAGAVMIAQPGDDSGFGQESFRIDHDGAHHWGAEGAALDTQLVRSHPGQLEMGDPTGIGTQFNFGVGGDGGSPGLYMQVDGDGDDYIFLAPWQDTALILGRHGAGIQLHSPDGSQAKTLRLSNAGALELV